jgi:hypothetical protein
MLGSPAVSLLRRRAVALPACLLALTPLVAVGSGWVRQSHGAAGTAAAGVDAERAESYADAVAAITADPMDALARLERLRASDSRNALPLYLEASVYARRDDWAHACESLKAGNAKPELLVYASSADAPNASVLAALRELAADCAAAAPRLPDADLANGENVLWECASMANRLAQDARPSLPQTRQTAGAVRVAAERGRITVFEEQGRFEDADAARARLRQGARLLDATQGRVASR